ncbi:MAG: hypothetical protein N2Z58_06785 [Fervidobacterium sp.]|nr:hypothetical protein [Fervidobacterium sp.]
MKTDKDFFLRFPVGAIFGTIVGIILLSISIDFLGYIDFLKEFLFILKFIKNAFGIVVLLYFSFEILIYLLRFSPSKKFESHLSEIRKAFLEDATKDGSILIGDFISFRPWMEDEFYVKSKKGIPKIFIPVYLVAFTIKDDVIYIQEAKAQIQSKTYLLTGYYVVPTKIILSASFSQERILFPTKSGEIGATSYSIQIRTSGGEVKVELFEEEILSKYGNISNLREEFVTKVMMTIRMLNRNYQNK